MSPLSVAVQLHAPIAASAMYAHPVEHAIANLLPVAMGPIFLVRIRIRTHRMLPLNCLNAADVKQLQSSSFRHRTLVPVDMSTR